MRMFLAMIAFLVLTGCAATGPTFSEKNAGVEPLKPEPGKALVYIYRVKQYNGSGIASDVLDNNRKIGSLNIGGYLSLQADPGPHQFRTDVYVVDEPVSLELSEGKTYYLKIFVEGHFRVVFNTVLVPEKEALKDLEESHYQGS